MREERCYIKYVESCSCWIRASQCPDGLTHYLQKQHLPWPLLVLNGGSGASASDNSAASVAQANQRLVEFRKQLKSEQQQLEQYFEDHSSPVFTEAYFRRVKQRARDNCPPAKVVSPTTSAAAAVAAEKTLPNGAARYEEYRRSIQHKIIQGSREQPYTPPNPPTPGIPKPVKVRCAVPMFLAPASP